MSKKNLVVIFLLGGVTLVVLFIRCPALLIFYNIFKVIETVVKLSLVRRLGLLVALVFALPEGSRGRITLFPVQQFLLPGETVGGGGGGQARNGY